MALGSERHLSPVSQLSLGCSVASSRTQKLIHYTLQMETGQSELNHKGTLKWEMRLSVPDCSPFPQLLKMQDVKAAG